jgi:hypothetical protein
MQADTREQAPVVRITMVTPSGTQVVNYTLRETKMTTIGRAPDNVIVINNLHISKYHCTIELIDGEYFLHDHSLNGSWLNGVKLMPNACGIMLHHDDVRARAPCANNCAACPCASPLTRLQLMKVCCAVRITGGGACRGQLHLSHIPYFMHAARRSAKAPAHRCSCEHATGRCEHAFSGWWC